MKSYLKRKLSYGEKKSKNTLDYFNHYQSNLRFNLIVLPIVISEQLVALIDFLYALTAGLILSVVFN
jgi:hypothetical protein